MSMEIHWHLEILFFWLGNIPLFLALILQMKYYLKTRYKAVLYWFGYFFCQLITYILITVGEMLLSSTLYIIGVFFFIPYTFLACLAIDALQREWVSPKKLCILGFIACAVFITGLLPNATEFTENLAGDRVVIWSGYFRIAGSVSNLLP